MSRRCPIGCRPKASSRSPEWSPPPCRRSMRCSTRCWRYPASARSRAPSSTIYACGSIRSRRLECRCTRTRALRCVEPAEADWIALTGEQRRGLVERQPDHVGVGADDLHDEAAGDALCGIAAGLAAPLTGGEIGLDVLVRQPLEADLGLDQALAKRLGRRDQADRGVDPVIAPGEEAKALPRLVEQLGLGQDAAAD